MIVCTRNRARSLQDALESISRLTVPTDLMWEVVVVDNNSTDDTRDFVEAFLARTGLPIKYVFEPSPGLSRARNRAIHEASGDVLAFIDDDVVLDAMWLVRIAEEFQSDDGIAVLFGRTRSYYPRQPRLSLKDRPIREYYRFPCSPWGVGHGNNMSMRTEVVKQVGYFDPGLGAGTQAGAAEDTDFVYRVLRDRGRVVYSPAPVAYHKDARSSRQDAVTRLNYARGRGAFYSKFVLRGDIFITKLLFRELRGLLISLIARPARRSLSAKTLMALVEGFGGRMWYELQFVHNGGKRRIRRSPSA